MQLMEDVWLGCRLDTHWNHPLNLGWTNLFQRWTSAATFRMWWPVLKPLYGSKFLRFMEEQMGLSAAGKAKIETEFWLVRPTVSAVDWENRAGSNHRFQARQDAEEGMGWQSWQGIQKRTIEDNQAVYAFQLMLMQPGSSRRINLQVALAIVTVDQKSQIVRWHENDFFVLPSLWGSGLGGRFLRAILSDLPKRKAVAPGSVCRVELPESRPNDLASRNDLIGVIDFYKAEGFKVFLDGLNKKLLLRKLDADETAH
jgi:hypothetical protein